MVDLQPVFLDPGGKLLSGQTLVALGRGGVHQKTVAGGCAERVDHMNRALGIAFL